MTELTASELLHDWKRLMESMSSSATSVTGHATELPRQLVEHGQHQLGPVIELIERERRMQRELTERMLAPLDAVLDLLEQSGAMLRGQAESLEAAARALGETAGMMRGQAELFEQTIHTLRQPVELVKSAAGPSSPPS